MLRIGVAGWDYPDWSGVVYPEPIPRAFDRLDFIAGLFDTIEINVTFYRQPDPRAAESWARRVARRPGFRFTAKLSRSLTHLTASRTGAPATDPAAEAAAFRAGIAPLAEAGLLGAVLAQFPQSFRDTPAARGHLERIAALFPGLPLVFEVRHESWSHDDALRLFASLGAGFCNIDQPRLRATLGPTGHATSRVAYIRLHGRNSRHWFARKADPAAGDDARDGRDAPSRTRDRRYDYLYSMQELEPWVERATRLDERAEEVYVVANNHFRGQAVANALMLKAALGRRRVDAPADLVEAYPALAPHVHPIRRAPRQGSLFQPPKRRR